MSAVSGPHEFVPGPIDRNVCLTCCEDVDDPWHWETTPQGLCDTCGGAGWCVYPSIEDQTLVKVPCQDCRPRAR